MISDENVINQSKDSIDTKKKITQPLKRYISAVKSLLSPIFSSHPNFNPKMKKSQSSLLLLSEGKRTIENGLFYKNGSCPRMKKMNVCIGDYEIKKKEKYVIQRNSYLMKSTRDIFLRYKNKIELKRVKLKMIN